MAPTGTFVVCEGGLHVNLRRVQKAAEAAGLVVVGHRPVVGRAGKPTLFGVWTMRRLDLAAGRRDDASDGRGDDEERARGVCGVV